MIDNVGAMYITNDSIEPVEKMPGFAMGNARNVYEVVRIIRGIPLFFEDHYLRLKNSLDLLGEEIKLSQRELKKQMEKLVSANRLKDCNVRLVVYLSGEEQNYIMYISKSYYPGNEEIEKGVKTSLLQLERENPNIKIGNEEYKELVARKIKEKDVFEVLLVNETGKITEGSKSNVFFVNGSRVFTTPGEYVLKGVTRQKIILVCKMLELELIETLISVDSLKDIEGAFLSGTSIKALPIADIDRHSYNSGAHPTITAIIEQYNKLIEDYIH